MSAKRVIYVVFKTHFDIGFTELAKEVIERYGRKMLPDVVKTCEDTQAFPEGRQYVWTMPAWPLLQSLAPDNAESGMIARAKTLIRKGQIAWHALPYTTHTEFCGLEEYIRGMYFSRRLSEEFGKGPLSAKMTDVPGHTWVLPSILYQAGVKFLHLGCNPGCTAPEVPRLFFWEGPDGNRVLTFYSKGGYGSSLLPPEDWGFPVWLALIQTNDNAGPQKPEIIQQLIDRADSQLPGAEVIVGTMDDFYRALSQYSLEDIPVIKGDLADTWIHGVGSYPAEVGKIRRIRQRTASLEKALVLGREVGSIPLHAGIESQKLIDGAYEQTLLFGEHTWGLDVKTTLGYDRQYGKKDFNRSRTKAAYQRIEESWKEQRDRVALAEESVCRTLPGVMDTLASRADAEGARIVVFNGLGWKRNAWVDMDNYSKVLEHRQLMDLESGQPVRMSNINSRTMAYLENMPALGYKTLGIREGSQAKRQKGQLLCDAALGVLENKWFRLSADKGSGGIKSLVEKSCGKEWVDSNQKYSFGQYRYDIYGIEDITEFIRAYAYRFSDWLVNDLGRLAYPEQMHLTVLPSEYTIEGVMEDGAASLILRKELGDESVTEYGNAAMIELQVTLYENQPYIDMTFKLSGKEETPLVEAGHFVFPVNLKEPEVRINKTGCVIDPGMDIVKDANHLLYCCENWLDISDGVHGMAVVPFDTPLFSIGDEGIYKYRKEYEKSAPVLFFNAFNNSWGTNFPQWIGGDFVCSYRLIPHSGNWVDGEVPKLALEAVTEPLTGFAEKKNAGDKLKPATVDLIQELEGMEVICFKLSEKGDGYVMRVREMYALRKEVRLVFSKRFKSIGVCGLLEDNFNEIAANTDSIVFSTKPFEIHTLYLKTGGS